MIDHIDLSLAETAVYENLKSNDEQAPSLQSLLKLLSADDHNTVISALEQISALSEDSQVFVPKLVSLTLHDHHLVRHNALAVLAQLKTDRRLIIYTIKKCLFDKAAEVRKSAANALAHHAGSAEEAVFELADRVLNDEDPIVRELCCYALGNIGPQAQAALPALSMQLRNGNASSRIAAARTIARVGQNAEILKPALIQALEDDNQHVRYYAAEALSEIQ